MFDQRFSDSVLTTPIDNRTSEILFFAIANNSTTFLWKYSVFSAIHIHQWQLIMVPMDEAQLIRLTIWMYMDFITDTCKSIYSKSDKLYKSFVEQFRPINTDYSYFSLPQMICPTRWIGIADQMRYLLIKWSTEDSIIDFCLLTMKSMVDWWNIFLPYRKQHGWYFSLRR